MPNASPSHPSSRTMQFDRVPVPRVQRSVFDKPSNHKTTFDSGFLIPLYVDEILPGDTVNMKATFFGRLQTLDFPILDNMFLDTFWFFCPNRILWTNWAKFLGAQTDPADSIDYSVPVMDLPVDPLAFAVGDMGDYFGLPIITNFADADRPIALPFRMYNLVYNEWYRDQNLQDSVVVDLDDGPDDFGDYNILRRGKRQDYITSCLPWPQKGDAVALPLGSTAPVIGDGKTLGFQNATDTFGLYVNAAENEVRVAEGQAGQAVGTAPNPNSSDFSELIGVRASASESGLIALLNEAVASTINDMREAIAVQQILERDARMGTRYTERIFGQFGVVVPDFTAQRPEYLGGSIDRVTLLQVPQTTASPATPTMANAKGALAAYAQVQAQSGFNRSFVEHGYIMCLVALRADINYQQRIDKMWNRETRYDFFDPMLAHLGEQAVLDREVWYDGTGAGVFGYQERWSEYRSKLNIISGKFRSDAAGTLDAWHLALDFTVQPVLNTTFIQDNPPLARVLAVDTEPQVLCDAYFKCRHVRAMPIRSTPGLERL